MSRIPADCAALAAEPVVDLAEKLIAESKPMDTELAAVLTTEARWDLYEVSSTPQPPTPPAPEVVGEVGSLVDSLNQVAGDFDILCNKIVNGECRTLACLRRGGYDAELCRARGTKPPDPLIATCPELEKAGAMRRAAALLQQLSAPAPAVVPVAERLRIVKRGIVAGYNLGHYHIVKGCWGDPDEVADDYAEEALHDLGDEPAPAVVPVPVSERLPGEGEYNANREVWTTEYDPALIYSPVWKLTELPRPELGQGFSDAYFWRNVTHWLPAHAIPLPQARM
jgi:hypothetical protein